MPRFRSLALLLCCAAASPAADWPQWLGPHRDGSSVEKVAPWKRPLRVAWRQAVGEGHSSPIVAGGKVFLHTRVKGQDEELVAAYDARTGEPLWQKRYPRAPFTSEFGNGPRATPLAADGSVYALGVTGLLSCLNADDGKMNWQVNALAEFKAPNLRFGVSCSPLLDGDRLLVNVGGKGASVVAFGKADGKPAWKSLDDPASYSSPILQGKGPEQQVIVLTQRGLAGLDPADGKPFWKFPFVDLLFESSTTPVVTGDLLLASSVTLGSVGLRLESKEGKPAASQVWKNPALNCYFSTPVVVGKDHVYLVTGSLIPPPQATLHCVEVKTGKSLWSRPKVGKYHASLLRTGDGKLLMLEDGGDLVLLDPDPKGYHELARSTVCGSTWAHTALANGRLYLRDEKELLCIELAP